MEMILVDTWAQTSSLHGHWDFSASVFPKRHPQSLSPGDVLVPAVVTTVFSALKKSLLHWLRVHFPSW